VSRVFDLFDDELRLRVTITSYDYDYDNDKVKICCCFRCRNQGSFSRVELSIYSITSYDNDDELR